MLRYNESEAATGRAYSHTVGAFSQAGMCRPLEPRGVDDVDPLHVAAPIGTSLILTVRAVKRGARPRGSPETLQVFLVGWLAPGGTGNMGCGLEALTLGGFVLAFFGSRVERFCPFAMAVSMGWYRTVTTTDW
jgi:hypothetical protein